MHFRLVDREATHDDKYIYIPATDEIKKIDSVNNGFVTFNMEVDEFTCFTYYNQAFPEEYYVLELYMDE